MSDKHREPVVLKATDVFTPSDFPTYTYVERADAPLEKNLRDALATPGEIVSVSGPSKSGKTVLIEKVVGVHDLITVTGAGVRDPEALWDRVLDWMEVPASIATATSRGKTTGGSIKAGSGFFGVSGEAQLVHSRESGGSHSEEQGRKGMTQVIREIANSGFVLLIDDYHYMPREVQTEMAKQLKEAARQGVKICTASVPHRADDVVRSNPELRGRVRAIDVGYWPPKELARIPEQGFKLLNAVLSKAGVMQYLNEISGSPQLMQAACLQTCFEFQLRETAAEAQSLDPDAVVRARILEETAARTDFGSLVRDMHSGPKTRGTERKEFVMDDGTKGDVYRAVLQALAANPARLSFPYNELFQRIQHVCHDDVPQAASIYQACYQIAKMAEDRSPTERIIEWDEESSLLDIVDPYFLFFLRWSNRLKSLGTPAASADQGRLQL